jgi:hypothetical protein
VKTIKNHTIHIIWQVLQAFESYMGLYYFDKNFKGIVLAYMCTCFFRGGGGGSAISGEGGKIGRRHF